MRRLDHLHKRRIGGASFRIEPAKDALHAFGQPADLQELIAGKDGPGYAQEF